MTQISLLFQDNELLIINKPAGVRSVPDGYDDQLPHLRSILEPEFGVLWMVHRLDKETSGVMVLARNPDAHRDLNQAFRDRQVSKKYHALVAPKPEWGEKTVNLPLRTDADRQHRTRVDQVKGKSALTKFTVSKWFEESVLLEIEIFTGVTHQIRAHLRAFDLAILGDDLYSAGLGPQPATTPRMMLHAREISFTHPATGARHHFTAPYPDDFREAYQLLRSTRDPDAWI